MLLTVSTTHEPATDLGYLLVKHPDRVHEFDVPTGRAYVCFPEADARRCTAALVLEVDPRRLSSGRADGFSLGRFVNDRPYAASSLLSSALNRAFRTAMGGHSKDRPELAATAIPLELRVPALRCRGGAELAGRLFTPLGWTVDATAIPLDPAHPEWGDSPYVDLRLTGTRRLADALNHVYVLLPVLDDAKHYWLAPDEVDKLIRAGEGWLAAHPERALITRRYLAHRRALTEPALERLAEADDRAEPESVQADADEDAALTGADDDAALTGADEDAVPTVIDGPGAEDGADADAAEPVAPVVPLAQARKAAVLAVLAASGATRVLDLGCGPGALLAELLADRRYTDIVGVDVSAGALAMAARRLRLDRPGAVGDRQHQRVRLLQSALTYRDARLAGYDAAILMEVIEHVDEERLPALAASVFGAARPATVIVTTPNAEYNPRYATLPAGMFRHRDHRFEWTRTRFQDWATAVGRDHGYTVAFHGVGDPDPDVGSPTQMAVFTWPS